MEVVGKRRDGERESESEGERESRDAECRRGDFNTTITIILLADRGPQGAVLFE